MRSERGGGPDGVAGRMGMGWRAGWGLGGGPGGVLAGRMGGGGGTYVYIARKGVCMVE